MKNTLIVIALSIFVLSAMFLIQIVSFYDGKLHVVFCDVGQGDAIFIRTPNGSDILVDAGTNNKVLECLSSHMPFWDRDIELVFLTHPHLDHFYGIFSILKHYHIKQFITEELYNDTSYYQELVKLIKSKNIPIKFVFEKDEYKLDNSSVKLRVLSPSKELLKRTSPNSLINERSEFASLILNLSYDSFDTILTGDSQSNQLGEATKGLSSIDVLQVPHHGSKTGLTDEIMKNLDPSVAVISVGKNSYGHPTSLILSLLKKYNAEILRTDQNGDIEIISDGKKFSLLQFR